MAYSISPALQQVEKTLRVLSGSFENNGYKSVFDVIRTSRKQFIARNMSWLGLRGGKAWDLAMGQAQCIRRLFRENQITQPIHSAIPMTLSGQPVKKRATAGSIQGLVQDGPTWQNQFAENWQAYCQSGAPEAVDSPVSYLTWIYQQALAFELEIQASSSAEEVITLAERRPDLATLTVDNDAVNQQIPALQLVNEILENSITPSLPAGHSVDVTLAETRYPNLLPYHFPHDQVELSLLNADVPLEEIIGQSATDWPWFLNDSWRGERSNSSTELASRLAPEQQTLVTEADNSTASDLTSFYKTNLGLETTDYTPFEDLDTFTRQLGITVPQVEELVAGNGGGTSVTLSDNCLMEWPISTDEALAFISHDSGTNSVSLTLSKVGLSTTTGKFSSGIKCDATQQAEIYIDDNISSDGEDIKPFTLSFWCKIPENVPDQAIIATNKIDHYALSSKGITLFALNDGQTYQLELTASDGSKVPLSAKATFKPDAWVYIAIQKGNEGDSSLYLRGSNDGVTMDIQAKVDFSTLDSIVISEECWGFNSNKSNNYYNSYPERRAVIDYDDIAAWDKDLSDSTLENYIASGKSATTLEDKTHYYPLDIDTSQTEYGAAFINGAEFPAIVLDEPTYSELVLSNATTINGKYGQGIQTRSVDDSYFYFQPDGKMAQAMKGDKSFTLGFWSYRENTTVLPLPYVSNGADARDPSYAPGFELTSYDNNTDVQFAVTDSAGKHIANSWQYYIDKGKWFYIALSWDVEKNQADWYAIADNLAVTAPTVTLDASGLGDITTAEGFTWAFNIRGDLTRHDSSTENVINLIYDDIAVFNGALTATDINTITTSGKSIAEMDLSGFSASCIWASSLDRGLKNLSDARMDRINRMVRLQRWLGLSYEETDLLLSACIHAQGTDNSDYSLNAHTLRALGVFRHWQQKYGISAFEFAAVLDVITPYAISPAVPFFDQIFNSPSLFDAPFAITGADFSYTDLTGDSARTVRQICAGLDITQAQFRVLADRVAAAKQGDAAAQTLPLTLAVVSALYRLVMVPRWLGLAFADGAALLSLAGEGDTAWTVLAGVPQLAALSDGQPADGDILDLLMALEAAAGWAADHKLSWVKNYLALKPETDALVATSATVNFVNGIRQQLPAALLSEQSFASVLLPEYNSCVNIHGSATHDDSPLGIAHGIKLDSTQGQYAVFTDAADALITGTSSYTIAMWVKVTSGASVNFPVIANASAYNSSTSPGIFIGLASGYHLNISIASDDANTPLISDNSKTSWQADKWFWLAIATDVTQKTVTVYAYSEDGKITSSVSLAYKGSILTESDNCWALSQNGALNNTGTHGIVSYDDVTVWDSVLTAENVKAIVASGKPATLTLPATLPILVADTDFLSDLIDSNGLVLPAAADYDTIATMVSMDIDAADITFATDADREQAVSTLSGIINQARLTQNGIADSALAQMFSTAQSLPPFLLQWAGDSEYRLLSDSLGMNSGAALTDPSQIPASYLTNLFAVGQRAGISTAFTLTPATLSLFLAHPDWFGVSNTTLTLTLLYRFSRYADWLGVAGDEDRVLGYLAWVNNTTTPDATQAAEALALLLDWENSEVADATAGLDGGLAKTVADVDYVMRLQTLSMETGLSVTPLLATGELVPGGVTETWDAWQAAGESLVAAQSGQQ